jgi:hypothetical protein
LLKAIIVTFKKSYVVFYCTYHIFGSFFPRCRMDIQYAGEQ